MADEIDRFLSDRPHLTRLQIGKLCHWNVIKLLKQGVPATELELHAWLQRIPKKR